MNVIRLLPKLLVLALFALILSAPTLYAQSSTDNSLEAEPEMDEEDGQTEGQGGSRYVKGIRMDVFIKNVSSFKKTLTAYDNVCRRYVFSVKRFRAYQKQRVKICLDEDGFGDITVSRLTGMRKKRYKQVEESEIVKFP